MTRDAPLDWRAYLDRFHAERPGVTEDVLARTLDRGQSPYQWAREAIPERARVLDLACGTAPLFEALGGRWVGVDRSAAELRLAVDRGAAPVARGDATAIPFDAECFDAVLCSMGLMLVQPLGRALAESARVLRPGGRLIALVPDARPLRLADRFFYLRLLAVLGRTRLRYPNDGELRHATPHLERAGLHLVADDRRRFAYPLDDRDASERFVNSLYLPDREPNRLTGAVAIATRRVGTTIGIPIRRLIAQKRSVD